MDHTGEESHVIVRSHDMCIYMAVCVGVKGQIRYIHLDDANMTIEHTRYANIKVPMDT